ncbi:MAG: NAD-dependent epimerase/dehydratase family protein [Nanoarchaeota archaeon]
MQGVVFGLYTPECDREKIFTRFDSDEAFGTVLNRFIIQALLGKDLTIYGEGKHQRGFISLNDSIQALEIAIENEPKKGEARV